MKIFQMTRGFSLNGLGDLKTCKYAIFHDKSESLTLIILTVYNDCDEKVAFEIVLDIKLSRTESMNSNSL